MKMKQNNLNIQYHFLFECLAPLAGYACSGY